MNIRSAVSDYAPTRGITMILGIGMLLWGVWVLLPFVALTGPLYSTMLSFASEPVWGAVFAYGGATLTAGTFGKDVDWIKTGAFIGFTLWFILAILGVIADPAATPIVTRGIIAAMHAWVYIQVKVNPELVAGTIKVSDVRDYINYIRK